MRFWGRHKRSQGGNTRRFSAQITMGPQNLTWNRSLGIEGYIALAIG